MTEMGLHVLHICHVDIQYYFITDVIHCGGAQVTYCPTGKPLQGTLFCKFHNAILNVDNRSSQFCFSDVGLVFSRSDPISFADMATCD